MASSSFAHMMCSALALYCFIGFVSCQGTCSVLPNTGLDIPLNQGTPVNQDDCCSLCQGQIGCTVSLYDLNSGNCFLVGAGDELQQDLLIENQIGSSLFFPGEITIAAANNDGPGANDEIIFGLGVPQVAGIVGAFIGLICIVGSLIAFCRARTKQRRHQAVLRSSEIV